MNITDLTLVETIRALGEKSFSYQELNKAYLERINKYNEKLNAYLTVNQASDKIPAGIKDIISTKGIKTTAGSGILENYIPPYNATVIERLYANNISILGKTNNDEFAMGSSGENSAYGVTKNPWNLNKVPGGSSSGSAVAVASDMCVFALGTDTGGSIRQPASLCGVVGLKPSYGRVSRYGLISMASSLDCPGPITKSVEDARLVLSWVQGEDYYDSNCHLGSKNNDYMDSRLRGNDSLKNMNSLPALKSVVSSFFLKKIKVGVPKEFFEKGLDEGVERLIKDGIKKLEELGAEIVDVTLPHSEYAVAVYYVIMFSEVSANLARFDGIRFGFDRSKFGIEAKRRIMLGTFTLSSGYYDAYFRKAAKVRNLIKKDFDKAFKVCDVIVGPVSPTPAWNIGEKINDPLTMYMSDVYTVPASLSGLPGISIPCGFVNNLPVGLQILGKYMEDETVLDIAEIYEKNTTWRKEKPRL